MGGLGEWQNFQVGHFSLMHEAEAPAPLPPPPLKTHTKFPKSWVLNLPLTWCMGWCMGWFYTLSQYFLVNSWSAAFSIKHCSKDRLSYGLPFRYLGYKNRNLEIVNCKGLTYLCFCPSLTRSSISRMFEVNSGWDLFALNKKRYL